METANSKVLLFIVASSITLIEHEILNPEKGTTKVVVSKLQPVYYIFNIQICLLSTEQILQSGLRVKDNKSGSTFCNKSDDTVPLATPNLWNNIQIIRTYILKYNIFNPVSLAIRYLNFETLHHCFGHISNKIIYHVLNNVEDVKNIYFLTQKKIYQHSFPKNTVHSSELLELIHSYFFELPILSYLKYK